MLLFLVAAARAIVEMLLLCMLGQAVLYLLAGRSRVANPIYRLFATIVRPVVRLFGKVLPPSYAPAAAAPLAFVSLLLTWLGLAILKKSI